MNSWGFGEVVGLELLGVLVIDVVVLGVEGVAVCCLGVAEFECGRGVLVVAEVAEALVFGVEFFAGRRLRWLGTMARF